MKNKIEHDIQQLKSQQAALEQKVAEIEEKRPKEKVLAAIAKQKYFYLKELPHIIFDRDTSYLWPEKELDISMLKTELTGENLADGDEVNSLLKELSQVDYLNMTGWEIPTPYDFQSIIDTSNYEDSETLPSLVYRDDDLHCVFRYYYNQRTLFNFEGKLLFFAKCSNWPTWSTHKEHSFKNAIESESAFHQLVYQNKLDKSWAIEFFDKNTLKSNQFFLVNKSFAVDDYLLDSSFDKLSEKEQGQVLKEQAEKQREDFLTILLKNSFLPIFDNHKIAPLYDLLLNDLPKLNAELNAVNAEIERNTNILNQQQELLSSELDYRQLLAFHNFNCADIDTSIIRFSYETIRWCDLLLDKAAEYQIRQYKLITEGNNLTSPLTGDYKNDRNLSDEENNILKERRYILNKKLNMDMNTPSANLGVMKLQCFELKKELASINAKENGLTELGKLAAKPRASFDLVAENSATMLTDTLKHIEFYENNKQLVTALVNAESSWHKDFKAVKSVSKEKLKHECEEDGIEEALWLAWFNEWSEKRLLIEKCLQPLLEKGAEGAFTSHTLKTKTPLAIKLIELLTSYKTKVDEFYLTDRKSIHQKFAFQDGGELQEKFEAESELYKHTINFQTSLHEIVFSLEKVEERLWLFQWGDALVDMAIDVVLDFIRDKELDSISQTIINDFTQLRLQNYATFINDAKAHAEMSAKWDKEYNSLMFKMRKELNQEKVK